MRCHVYAQNQRALPLLLSSYGLMRQTKTLALSRFYSDQCVFAGCCKSLLGDGLSRHYLRNPCVGAWTPTPQRPFSAFARFFLKDNGLTLDVTGSARQICPCNATSTGNSFSRLRFDRLTALSTVEGQSFRYVQAPTLARPPRLHPPLWFYHRAAGPFTPRIARLVTCLEMWYRYVSDTSN